MRKLFRLMIAALCMCSAVAAWAGDFEDGVAAYNKNDYAQALKKLGNASEQGNSGAQFYLGNMYEKGKGVAQDYAEAARLYRLAAMQGVSEAQYNLALLYFGGFGVLPDNSEAAKWFRLSVKKGSVEAQEVLSLLYFSGSGVVQDYVKAHMWANIASSSGGEKQLETRRQISKLMTPQQISEAQKMASECVKTEFKSCGD